MEGRGRQGRGRTTWFQKYIFVSKSAPQKHTNEVHADKADKTQKRDWTQSHSTHYIRYFRQPPRSAYIHSADRSSYTPLPLPNTCLRHVKGARYPHHPHMPPARSSRMPRRHSDATHPTSPPAPPPTTLYQVCPYWAPPSPPSSPPRARHAGRTLFFHVL